MKNLFRKFKENTELRDPADILRIIGDAAVASQDCGEGRLIPVLIVDTTDRSDVDELVRVHQHSTSGDVRLSWARSPKDKNVYLMVDFTRPVELRIVLAFNPETQGSLIDLILKSRAMFLQPGEAGDRLSTTYECPRILIEVPDLKFESVWQRMKHKILFQRFRADGLSRREAKLAVRKVSEEWDKLCDYRMNTRQTSSTQDPGATLRRQILSNLQDDQITSVWNQADDETAVVVIADLRDKLGKDLGTALVGSGEAERLSECAEPGGSEIPTIMTTVPRSKAAAGLSEVNPKISRALTKTAVPNAVEIVVIAGGGTSLVYLKHD